jgi:hypothetical protein
MIWIRKPTFSTLYKKKVANAYFKVERLWLAKPEQSKRSRINWSSNGKSTGRISIKENNPSKQPCIELNYKYNV